MIAWDLGDVSYLVIGDGRHIGFNTKHFTASKNTKDSENRKYVKWFRTFVKSDHVARNQARVMAVFVTVFIGRRERTYSGHRFCYSSSSESRLDVATLVITATAASVVVNL
jgi:hypothetical protein